jgi:hypothetical protein
VLNSAVPLNADILARARGLLTWAAIVGAIAAQPSFAATATGIAHSHATTGAISSFGYGHSPEGRITEWTRTTRPGAATDRYDLTALHAGVVRHPFHSEPHPLKIVPFGSINIS